LFQYEDILETSMEYEDKTLTDATDVNNENIDHLQ